MTAEIKKELKKALTRSDDTRTNIDSTPCDIVEDALIQQSKEQQEVKNQLEKEEEHVEKETPTETAQIVSREENVNLIIN